MVNTPERIEKGNLLEQSGLEALLERIRGTTPALDQADKSMLYRLLATARPGRTRFRRVARELGVEEHANRIRGEIGLIYQENPWLASYFEDYGTMSSPNADASGVPTLKRYSQAMQLMEERRMFGTLDTLREDMERAPYS